ncbi:MAG: transglycosylase SLT domain-containing protein, partial [Candidatus Latescibacterota bacterium]
MTTRLGAVALVLCGLALLGTGLAARHLLSPEVPRPKHAPRTAVATTTPICGPADAMMTRGQYAQANQLLQRGADGQPDPACRTRIEFQRAWCELALDRAGQARLRLERLADADPRLEEYRRLWLATAIQKTGDRNGAVAAYGDLMERAASPGVRDEAARRLAESSAASGDPARALAIYARLLTSRPGDPELLRRIARTQETGRDRAAALAAWLRLAQERPAAPEAREAAERLRAAGTPEAGSARAAVFTAHRLHDRAAAEYRRLLRSWPKHSRAGEWQCGLGVALTAINQFDKAQAALTAAFPGKGYPAALYHLGRLQVRRDRDREAIAAYRRLAGEFPAHELAPEALWQAGKAAERLGRFTEAADCYRELAERYPRDGHAGEAAWSVGFMGYCSGDWARAASAFAALATSDLPGPLVDQARYWEGKAEERLGHADQAEERFRQAAAGFPRSYYSTRAVARGYAPDRPLSGRSSSIATSADEVPLNLAPAQALHELGLEEIARRELQLLEEEDRDRPAAMRRLRDQYEAFGWYDRALRISGRIWSGPAATPEDVDRAYPDYYWSEVTTAADEAGLDPFIIMAVIRQESAFAADAVSAAGAVGLMQLLPQTGRTVARELGIHSFDDRQLTEPRLALRLGARYLRDQVRQFAVGPAASLSLELALAAYNAGPER